jgi:hypothetical protein
MQMKAKNHDRNRKRKRRLMRKLLKSVLGDEDEAEEEDLIEKRLSEEPRAYEFRSSNSQPPRLEVDIN